jgi:flagellar basal body-associated protein FliL
MRLVILKKRERKIRNIADAGNTNSSGIGFFPVTKVVNPRFAPMAVAQTADDQQSSSEDDEEEGIMYELGTLLANPADLQTRRIMKVGVSLEVTSDKLIKEI